MFTIDVMETEAGNQILTLRTMGEYRFADGAKEVTLMISRGTIPRVGDIVRIGTRSVLVDAVKVDETGTVFVQDVDSREWIRHEQ